MPVERKDCKASRTGIMAPFAIDTHVDLTLVISL